MRKLYDLTGLMALIPSIAGTALLAYDKQFLYITYWFWLVGGIFFASHFSLIGLKSSVILFFCYFLINSYGFSRLADFEELLLYTASGAALISVALLNTFFGWLSYSTTTESQAGKPPILAKVFEWLAVIAGLSASILLAMQVNPFFTFFILMFNSVFFVAMSVILKTNYVLTTQVCFSCMEMLGVYRNATLETAMLVISVYLLLLLSTAKLGKIREEKEIIA